MNLITLKDYAKQNNVSYEAVRQQVTRYVDELGEHIVRDGRQQFLDEEAVAFLDTKRQKNPVVIVQQNKDEEIEELKNLVENLRTVNTEQANKIAALSEWKADNAVAIAEANYNLKLLEAGEETIKDLKAQNAVLSHDIAEKDKTLAELDRTAHELSDELTAIKGKWWYKLLSGKK